MASSADSADDLALHEVVSGGDDNDTIIGGDSAETLSGGAGDDSITGGLGAVIL